MTWRTLLFFGSAIGLACSFAKFLHYWKLVGKEIERLETKAMHEELDRLELRDILDAGQWR